MDPLNRVARRRGQRRAGFSLVELMIAMVVLGIGLLGVTVMQVTALREGAKGHHTSTALSIARDHYEQMLRMPYSGTNLAPVAWTNPPWINNAGYSPGEVPVVVSDATGNISTEQVYRVFYRVSADTGIAPDPPNPDLRLVDIEVRWDEAHGRSNKKIAFNGVIVNNDR
jgi:type IV pilus assembly protein PilV